MARFVKVAALAAVLAAAPLALWLADQRATAEQPPQPAAQPAEAPAPRKPQKPQVQVGPWVPAAFNIEEPYVNIVHASRGGWTADGMSVQQLFDEGVIDRKTGLPVRLPNGKTLTSDVYFTGNTTAIKMHWDGEWVLEWEGDADLWMLYLPNELQWKTSKNRLEFTRDFKRGKTPYHAAIQVRRLNGPLKSVRMYRKENEAAIKAGKIYNPKFAEAVARYDVVRTMDLQGANTHAVRSVDELPGMEAAFWANAAWQTDGSVDYPFRSAPLDAMTALSMETGSALWTTVPISLGNPVSFYDPAVRRDASDQWAGTWRTTVRGNPAAVMDSPEWDRYADAFVASLERGGYPQDRPVYVTIANEVWNFAGLYFMTTQYAMGIAEGLGKELGINDANYRHGYGIASARWKLALDGALERAGREQNVVYVIEGQAVWHDTTRWALDAAKRYLESKGETWADHAKGFGVSVASYWGVPPDELTKAGVDPNDGAALEDYFIRGTGFGSVAHVVKDLKEHEKRGAEFGVPFIGAYEGGSHFERPPSMKDETYKAWLWGEPGARVNRAVNDALAEAFPGIILSNYGLAGSEGGQPWFEGPIGADNPYARSWEPYLRHAGALEGTVEPSPQP